MTHPALTYFSAVRPVAAAAGVALPPDSDLRARHAETEGIDLPALAADGAALVALGRSVAGAVAASETVRAGLPAAWTGRASEAASESMELHRGSAETTLGNVRSASSAVAAAVDGLSRIIAAKHSVLKQIPSNVVVGQPLADLTADDVEANRSAVATEIGAKLAAFESATATAASAAAAVLSVLAEAVAGIRVETYPVVAQSFPDQSGARPGRDRAASGRPGPVADRGATSARPELDPEKVVAAVAAVTGAAIASTSAIAAAAAAGVSAALDHTGAEMTGSPDAPHGAHPADSASGGADPAEHAQKDAASAPAHPTKRSLLNLDTTPNSPVGDHIGPTDTRASGPAISEPARSEPVVSAPASESPPAPADSEARSSETAPRAGTESGPIAGPAAGEAGAHPLAPGSARPVVPQRGGSDRHEQTVDARSDTSGGVDPGDGPDNDGGLALAGDR